MQTTEKEFTPGITVPELAAMHREADAIQQFMNVRADLLDPASLTFRLNEMDAYQARLAELLFRAKYLKEYTRTAFNRENEDKLSKMTATNSNRSLNAHLFEYTVTYERLETMYKTLSSMSDHLVTQISYIKKQMEIR